MDHFVMGLIAMCFFVAGLFFLRFWRDTRDRLFLTFAISFWLLGLTRMALAVLEATMRTTEGAAEYHYLYWIRLVAFLLILAAIIDKNRPRKTA